MSQPSDTAPLDAETIVALRDEVASAKVRGWMQADLREYFVGKGVILADYLAASRGEAIEPAVRSVLAAISIAGLPPAAPSDPYPDIPVRMKTAKRWLLWRAEPNEDPTKKPRKVPVYVNGERRSGALDSPGDVARLSTYAEAVASITPAHAGLGFALGPDGDKYWQGIDLDNLSQHPGLQFVADDLPGYTEKSPSGLGVHAIGYGRTFTSLGSNSTGIEAYAHGRYFTVTGESTGTADVEDIADFVEKRLAPLHSPTPQDTSAPADGAHTAGGSLLGALAGHDLRSALTAVRADDRDVWIRLGHALKSLGEQGRALWLEWSQTSDKYDPADAARVWESFKPERTGYQAVFAEAQRCGWVNPGAGRGEAPRPETPPEDDKPVVGPFRASELAGEPPERRWVVKEWIVEGAVNSLYGDGGLGKTLLAQQLACSVALGAPWLGLETVKGSVLAILCEDDRNELWRRHNEIKAAMGYAIGNPFEDVWLWPRVGEDNVLVRWDRDGKATLGDFARQVVQAVNAHAPAVLILDTLADFFGGNEIDRVQVNYFVKTVLGGLIKERAEAGHPLTILLLGHPSVGGKADGRGFSGSTAWNNSVRSRIYLTRPDEGSNDERVLTRGKANYAASGDETAIRLFYSAGVLRAHEDIEDTDSLLWAAMRETAQVVGKAWDAGAPYTAAKGSKKYLFAALPAELMRRGFKPELARQAVRTCVDDQWIGPGRSNTQRGFRSLRDA